MESDPSSLFFLVSPPKFLFSESFSEVISDRPSSSLNFEEEELYFSHQKIQKIFSLLKRNLLEREFITTENKPKRRRLAYVAAALFFNKKEFVLGFNSKKSNPFQAKYGKNKESIFFHAETNAIKKAIDKDLIFSHYKTTLFVARIKRTPFPDRKFVWGIAKPCRGCMTAIVDMKIDHVIYTLDSNDNRDISNPCEYEILIRKR